MSTRIITKSYSELITLPTFAERFHYLKIGGTVGARTFGDERYLNQLLYRSYEWKRTRRDIIVRDNGLDLGCYGCEIVGNIIVHHINPITIEDVLNRNPIIFDPENLISCGLGTHNAVHYGDESLLADPIERTQFDTCPWRRA
jgi:hypothetical protein